ncbi:MAG: 2-oxoacid:ferredoxin oxidoreductase subunit beta, partial [Alphaproteobacteria bacterium]|nr:2-oxoacid:ferredoxin oxidoreductase subunit beta [Alphaproteobacteria bacterium]
SGDPNGTAKLIADAMKHPGFSLVQILSPCVTFRPEQKDWKGMVRPAEIEATSDIGRAARRLMTDDGFNTGILYKGSRNVYRPALEESETVAEVEATFAL